MSQRSAQAKWKAQASCGTAVRPNEACLADFNEQAPPQSADQVEAIAHMAATLDARQESLTLLTNFRVDGAKFANLLFMTPIAQARAWSACLATGHWSTTARPALSTSIRNACAIACWLWRPFL